MRDHPIIFSAPMVRALLEGRKTMTRRLARRRWRSVPRAIGYGYANEAFEALWTKLHGPMAWEANPEVVVVAFTARMDNIDKLKDAA